MEAAEQEILYTGKIFEIVRTKKKVRDKTIVFESARRAPGVRLLILKGNNLLISKEFRYELKGYDYRLAGGKVFDTLEEYDKASKKEILKHAELAARKECEEETGLRVDRIQLLEKTHAGATVDWDLYYFIIDEFTENGNGQKLEEGEIIETVWKSFDEVRDMCLNRQIKEDRSVGVLLRFFLNKNNRSKE